MNQRELQRVSVISACIKGDMACARAAALLCLSVRKVKQLGVIFIAANSPQAKGRVEPLWGVLQDRLASELQLAKGVDLDSANAVQRRFIADYNRRFAWRASKILRLKD